MYLGFLLEGKSEEEIISSLGDAEMVAHLDEIISTQKPCNTYIDTVGTMMALKITNNQDNIFDLVNHIYIMCSNNSIDELIDQYPIDLEEKEDTDEITYYIRNSK